MVGTAAAQRWKKLQRLSEEYKETYDAELRNRIAAELWELAVYEGTITRRKLANLPPPNTEARRKLAEDAIASLVGKNGFTAILQQHDPQRASLRTWFAIMILGKFTEYARASARMQTFEDWETFEDWGEAYAKHTARHPGELAAALVVRDALARLADRTPGFDPVRMFGIREFYDVAGRELTDKELEAMLAHLKEDDNAAAALSLGIPEPTYKSRMANVRKKLRRIYADMPKESDDADGS